MRQRRHNALIIVVVAAAEAAEIAAAEASEPLLEPAVAAVIVEITETWGVHARASFIALIANRAKPGTASEQRSQAGCAEPESYFCHRAVFQSLRSE